MGLHRIAVAVIAAALASAAQAGTLEDIQKRGTIRLGYSETSPPFSFKSPQGEVGGYSVDLCKRVAASIAQRIKAPGLKTEWVALTPATRVEAVAMGNVDLECGTTTTSLARRDRVEFSVPIFVDASTLMGRESSVATMAQVQGKKIAVAENTTTLGAVDRALARRGLKAEIVKTKTVAEGFELLRAGKVDALAGDRTVLVGTFYGAGGAQGLTVFAEDLSLEPYGLMLRRGDPDFRLAVDRALAQVYRTEIDAVYNAWLQPLGKPTQPLLTMYLLNALPD
jgi:glutamate/aspartate transport system substrate-binding protein